MHIPKYTPLIAGVLLSVTMRMAGQAPPRAESFSIDAYPGHAKLMRYQGRLLVDLEDLAQITKGSLKVDGDRIILTLPSDASSSPAGEAPNGFSRPFMRAAIEAMASIREWGGILMATVQRGYPVDNTMAGDTLGGYQGRATDNVGLAAAAASNDFDREGLELLRNELAGMQAWSDRFVEARHSSRAASLTTSEHGIDNDAYAQKLIRCGRFLAQMFASGTFQDDPACH